MVYYNQLMLFSLAFTNPLLFTIIAVVLILSLSVHEFFHAFVADKLGDPTPRSQGRVTLNPVAHLDPMGTLALFLVGFGWGKPVMFNPYHLKNPLRDTALIALAGPASNLLIAFGFGLLYKFGLFSAFNPVMVSVVVTQVVSLNVMLAIFNLVPVFPLDGEKILRALLPKKIGYEYAIIMQRYGMLILLALIIPIGGVSAMSYLISPIINHLTLLLIG